MTPRSSTVEVYNRPPTNIRLNWLLIKSFHCLRRVNFVFQFFLKLQYYRAEFYESLRLAKRNKKRKSANDNPVDAPLSHDSDLANDEAMTDTGTDPGSRTTMDVMTAVSLLLLPVFDYMFEATCFILDKIPT